MVSLRTGTGTGQWQQQFPKEAAETGHLGLFCPRKATVPTCPIPPRDTFPARKGTRASVLLSPAHVGNWATTTTENNA